MNWKLWLCVIMGVLVAHVGIFVILTNLTATPPVKPPEPNFKVRNEVYVDQSTGEKTVYREITVSTRLATPEPVSLGVESRKAEVGSGK